MFVNTNFVRTKTAEAATAEATAALSAQPPPPSRLGFHSQLERVCNNFILFMFAHFSDEIILNFCFPLSPSPAPFLATPNSSFFSFSIEFLLYFCFFCLVICLHRINFCGNAFIVAIQFGCFCVRARECVCALCLFSL